MTDSKIVVVCCVHVEVTRADLDSGQMGRSTANTNYCVFLNQTKCIQFIGPSLTGDFSLPEGERYHHVERSEATSVNGAADWLVVV